MKYVRRPTPVLAWQFQSEQHADWPAWVREHTVHSMNGSRQPSPSAVGTVIVPGRFGPDANAAPGDWLVLENYAEVEGEIHGGVIVVYTGGNFDNLFEAVETA